jgi:hypothetical protein
MDRGLNEPSVLRRPDLLGLFSSQDGSARYAWRNAKGQIEEEMKMKTTTFACHAHPGFTTIQKMKILPFLRLCQLAGRQPLN